VHNKVDRDTFLLAFDDLTEERGPTLRQLERLLNMSSPSLVVYRLEGLEEKGLAQRIGKLGAARGWRLTPAGKEVVARLRAEKEA
jgi:DNA-binding MarR family transcriptional regulator